MKTLNVFLALFVLAGPTAARGEALLGSCYRYLQGYKPSKVMEVMGENHAVQHAFYSGMSYVAAGTYTSNVALQNDLIVMGQDRGQILFTLARPTRSSWVSSWLALEFYEWKEGQNHLVSTEQVECFDAGVQPEFKPFVLEATGTYAIRGWPPPENPAIFAADANALEACKVARDGTGQVQRLGFYEEATAHENGRFVMTAKAAYRCY